MTAEVNVPDEAYEAGERAVIAYDHVTKSDAYDIASDVLRAAAPLIVVAELERIGVALCRRQQEMRAEDDRSIRSAALGEAITVLRDRVAELRGESR